MRRKRRRRRTKPKSVLGKRKRDDGDDHSKNGKTKLPLTKRARFSKPTISDLFMEFHGIKTDMKYLSNIPGRNSSTVDILINDYYTKDFIFRLMFFPDQLMFIAKQVKFGGSMVDKVLDDRTNKLQKELFDNISSMIIKEITFPIGSDRAVPNNDLKLIARSLTEHVIYSKTTYHFRYAILKLIFINSSVKEHVRKMIPELKFNTLIRLLENIFQAGDSTGIELQIHTENDGSKMITLIHTFCWAYMINFGMLIEAND